MEPEVYWKLFETTGAPEAYVLYKQALKEKQEERVQEQSPCTSKQQALF